MFAEKHSSLSSYAQGDSLLWTIRGGYSLGYPVAYTGEGPGGGGGPPYLYRQLRPEGPKKNFGDRPTSSLFKALDDRVPPLSQIHWSQMYNTQYNGHNGIRTCNLICNFHCAHLECAWYKSVASGS